MGHCLELADASRKSSNGSLWGIADLGKFAAAANCRANQFKLGSNDEDRAAGNARCRASNRTHRKRCAPSSGAPRNAACCR